MKRVSKFPPNPRTVDIIKEKEYPKYQFMSEIMHQDHPMYVSTFQKDINLQSTR